jgi:hypothetical protein
MDPITQLTQVIRTLGGSLLKTRQPLGGLFFHAIQVICGLTELLLDGFYLTRQVLREVALGRARRVSRRIVPGCRSHADSTFVCAEVTSGRAQALVTRSPAPERNPRRCQ